MTAEAPERRKGKAGRPLTESCRLDDVLPDREGRTRREVIITAVRNGSYVSTAAAFAHVPTPTLYRWLADDRPRFRDFREALQAARAEAEMRHQSNVNTAAWGGSVVGRSTTRHPDGSVTVDERFTAPDGRLSMEYLARTSPSRYGRRQVLEVGPDTNGTPGGVDAELAPTTAVAAGDENVSRLLANFQRWLDAKAIEAPAADDDEGDVQDAEIVEDG